jgi:uncharacterized linocin/CFP29 family protein
MDLFKHDLAPLTDEAWEAVSNEATRVLESSLTGRRVVDFDGPHGMDFSGVNLGRLDVHESEGGNGIHYGIRRVLPLVEVRVPFELGIWELDDLARGARDVDLDPVIAAAKRLASFEDGVVFNGFEQAGIEGLRNVAAAQSASLSEDAADLVDAVACATMGLRDSGVGGPYALVLGPEPWRTLHAAVGYPVERRVQAATGGPILLSPAIRDGFLLSTRGQDFSLTVGQDASVGYQSHDHETVKLYLTESLTFRTLTPEAVVWLAR